MANNLDAKQLVLVGAGPMAIDYAKVFFELQKNFVVVCRSVKSKKRFEKFFNNSVTVFSGGIEQYLKHHERPSHVIIATEVQALYETTQKVLEFGVPNILVEKPACLSISEAKNLVLNFKKSLLIYSLAITVVFMNQL